MKDEKTRFLNYKDRKLVLESIDAKKLQAMRDGNAGTEIADQLENSKTLQTWFTSKLCDAAPVDGSSNIRHRETNQKAIEKMLADRYTLPMAVRILGVLEDQFQTLHRLSIKRYAGIVQELLYGGLEMYKKILFECLSNANGMICEHSLFHVLEMFREKDTYYFYRELLDRKKIPRYYNQTRDDSDATFFEAFAQDLRLVTRVLDFKRRLDGSISPINANAADGVFDDPKECERYGECDEVRVGIRTGIQDEEKCRQIADRNWQTFEKDMVHQILYVAAKVTSGRGPQDERVQSLIKILSEEEDLMDVRGEVIKLAIACGAIKQKKPLKPH